VTESLISVTRHCFIDSDSSTTAQFRPYRRTIFTKEEKEKNDELRIADLFLRNLFSEGEGEER
jgi:hypothetical protein